MFFINILNSSIEEVVFHSFIDNDTLNKNRTLIVYNHATDTILKGIYNTNLFFKRSTARKVFNAESKKAAIDEITKIAEGNRQRNQIAIESRTFNLYG